MIKYIEIINLIKLGLINKQQFIKIPKLRKSRILMNLFLKKNIITGFIENSNKEYLVFLNQFKPDIKILSKPSKKIYIKYKHLIYLNNVNSASNYIIHTSKGLVSKQECLKNKTGGVVFLKIN